MEVEYQVPAVLAKYESREYTQEEKVHIILDDCVQDDVRRAMSPTVICIHLRDVNNAEFLLRQVLSHASAFKFERIILDECLFGHDTPFFQEVFLPYLARQDNKLVQLDVLNHYITDEQMTALCAVLSDPACSPALEALSFVEARELTSARLVFRLLLARPRIKYLYMGKFRRVSTLDLVHAACEELEDYAVLNPYGGGPPTVAGDLEYLDVYNDGWQHSRRLYAMMKRIYEARKRRQVYDAMVGPGRENGMGPHLIAEIVRSTAFTVQPALREAQHHWVEDRLAEGEEEARSDYAEGDDVDWLDEED
jgi:hypothetical protein